MDFLIALILVAVLIASARIVGLFPLFGPGRTRPPATDAEAARRDRLERRMREVPDE